eukprot:20595-Amphidinium_carterae.1
MVVTVSESLPMGFGPIIPFVSVHVTVSACVGGYQQGTCRPYITDTKGEAIVFQLVLGTAGAGMVVMLLLCMWEITTPSPAVFRGVAAV